MEKFPDSMWTTLAPEELELCLTFKRQWKNCISVCQNNQSRNIRGKLVKVAHVKWHHRREPRNHLSQNWSYKSMPSAPPSNNRLNIISLPFSRLPGVQVACCTMLWCQAFFGASETSTCRQTLKILAKLLRRNSAGVTAGVNDKVVRNHRMKATPTRTRKVFTTPTPHATGGEHGVLVLRIIYEPCDQSSQTHLSAWDQKVEKVLLLQNQWCFQSISLILHFILRNLHNNTSMKLEKHENNISKKLICRNSWIVSKSSKNRSVLAPQKIMQSLYTKMFEGVWYKIVILKNRKGLHWMTHNQLSASAPAKPPAKRPANAGHNSLGVWI